MVKSKQKLFYSNKVPRPSYNQKKRQKRQESESRIIHAKTLRGFSTKYKTKQGCFNCQAGDSCILTYHHLNPKNKKFDIGGEVKKANITKRELIEEIRKCCILCLNCHTLMENKIIHIDFYNHKKDHEMLDDFEFGVSDQFDDLLDEIDFDEIYDIYQEELEAVY